MNFDVVGMHLPKIAGKPIKMTCWEVNGCLGSLMILLVAKGINLKNLALYLENIFYDIFLHITSYFMV